MAATFNVHPNQFAGASAPVKRPKEIACFSYDDQHQFHLGESGLRWYYPPRLGADLCQGFDSFEKLDDSRDDHLDSLLTTLAAYEEKTGKKTDVDFITWRGMMTKIMSAPYSDRDGYIEENHDYKLKSWGNQRSRPPPPGRPSQDMMSYWGYKFETLSLIPRPWGETSREYIESREQAVVNNHAQYCSVVRTGIGNATMILGGEVDAIWDMKPRPRPPPDGAPAGVPQPLGQINWVELKTSAELQGPRDYAAFERKLLKFWVQSFLLGVPRLIVGFRTGAGVLARLEEIDVAGIPSTVKSRGGAWDGNVCVNFAAGFLAWLRTVVTAEGGTYRIFRKERQPFIEVVRLEETGHGGIISEEFLNWRAKLDGQRSNEAS